MDNNIGVTLLIAEKRKKGYRATLISFIFEACSTESLMKKIQVKNDELKKSLNIVFSGIYDVFLVSENLQNGCMVGKSSIDEVNTILDAKSCIKKIEMYDFNLFSEKEREFVSELIYFYSDRKNKDSFMIIARFFHSRKLFKDVLLEIRKSGNSTSYKDKIIRSSEEMEELIDKNLKYIGISDLYLISSFAKKYGGYHAIYKEFDMLKDIEVLLPNQEKTIQTAIKILTSK